MTESTQLNLINSSKKRTIDFPDEAPSPLSKEGLLCRKKIKLNPLVEELKLKFREITFPSNHTVISQKYGIDFQKIKLHEPNSTFSDMVDLVYLIEECLVKHLLENSPNCRKKVAEIFCRSDLSVEKRLCELGLIYYYIDRDKIFFESDSYLNFRAQEIQTEIDHLKEDHVKLFGKYKTNLATGQIQYLLRTFSHMIVSSEQKFNLGGTSALYLIIQSELSMGFNLQEEHRNHILAVLKNLISQKQIKLLLEGTISVHPDLQEVITIDQKLPKESQVTATHTIRCILMTLFFDVRQVFNEPNCYAIAPLIYVSENATYKFIKTAIDWLYYGYFVSGKIKIPIAPLLQIKLSFDHGLLEPLDSERTRSSTVFQKMLNALNWVDFKESQNQNESFTNLLEKLTKQNLSTDKLPYAKKIFHSFKHNFLFHMILAIVEFQAADFEQKKIDLINLIIDQLTEKLPHALADVDAFVLLEAIRERLNQQMWFVPTSYHDIKNVNGQTKVATIEESRNIDFSQNSGDLRTALASGSILVFKDNDKLIFINKFTDLQIYLKNLIALEEKECTYVLYDCQEASLALQNGIFEKDFLLDLAYFAANTFQKVKLVPEELYNSNLLIFSQNGGFSSAVLNHFGVTYDTKSIIPKNGEDFLLNLKRELLRINPSIFQRNNSLLCGDAGHSYILYPNDLSEIRESPPKDFLVENIYAPLNVFLSSYIPGYVVERMFIRVSAGQELKEGWELFCKQYPNKPATYDMFRAFLMSNTPFGQIENMKASLDAEFYCTSLSENELIKLLSSFNIGGFDSAILAQEFFDKTLKSYLPPYIIARKLRHLLARFKLGFVSSIALERGICHLKNLPAPIVIADLNYSDDKEVPFHSKLVVRYHFGQSKLAFIERSRWCEDLYKGGQLSEFTMGHPKY